MFSDIASVLKSFKKYRVESILIVLSILITFLSLAMFILSSNSDQQDITIKENDKKINEETQKTNDLINFGAFRIHFKANLDQHNQVNIVEVK